MAIPNLFPLLDSSNAKLTQSADSLESALAQFSKLAASIEQPTVSGPLFQNGGGFDSWLAAEFQYGAFLGGDETSSVAPSPSTVSDESPLLELENLVGTGPSLFESSSLGLSNVPTLSLPQSPISSSVSNTTSFIALQRAAAELNIPWSEELGLAYLARIQNTPVEVPSLPTVSATSCPSPLASPVVPSVAATKTVSPSKTTTSNKKRGASAEEESEEVLAKRAKNTDAARRSRLKKLVKLETLEVKVHELEATNNRLNMRIAVLETEKNNFLIKDAEQAARIAQLEAKVVEAHLALTSRS